MTLLPEKTVKDKAMELTSIEYETELLFPENYGMTAGNFDGQGISHGCIQFPLGWGTLQGIWKDLYTNSFDMVKSKFTLLADFTSWEDWLLNKTIQQQIDHADITWTDWKLDGNGDRIPESGHNVKEPWKTYFRNLGVSNESQLRQQQEVDVIYHPNALKWFKDFGLWTRRGYALMFDISVQNGSINPLDVNQQPIDVMGRIFARFAALNTTGLTAEQIETEKMKIIVDERAKEVSSTWRLSYTERKSSIALGEFYLTTYGKTVSTVPYDMILEPAFVGYTKADIYVATSGDSFESIGQQYNTTAAKIQEMNPQVVDTNIYTGLSVNVPYQGAEGIGANSGIFLGTINLNKAFLGGIPIDKIFAGENLVYSLYVAPVEPPSINWIHGQNVSIASDGTITKTGGGNAWNAGADSTEQSDGSTDFIIEYIPENIDVRICFGLDEVVDGQEAYRNKDIDFNWEINPAGATEIATNEVKKYTGTYAANDVFRVALEGGIIRFYQNGVVKYENTDAINFPVLADVAIYNQDATFKANLIIPATITTTISPSEPAQSTIPFNVTLSNSKGKTIYYKIGTGTQQTYTAPFSVTQAMAEVQGTQITVVYWAEGEAEQTITYDTTTAIAGKPVVIPTAGNNQVVLNWETPANTTSYNIYRSEISGDLGTAILMYGWENFYTDTTALNGTTYYYTVKAGKLRQQSK